MADLAAALAALEAEVRDAPPAEVPALVARLGAVLAMAGARLAVPVPAPTNGPPEPDVLLTDVREVASIVRHSVSWVRRNGHTLPGFSQPGGKGTRVAWDRAALVAWANGSEGCLTGVYTPVYMHRHGEGPGYRPAGRGGDQAPPGGGGPEKGEDDDDVHG